MTLEITLMWLTQSCRIFRCVAHFLGTKNTSFQMVPKVVPTIPFPVVEFWSPDTSSLVVQKVDPCTHFELSSFGHYNPTFKVVQKVDLCTHFQLSGFGHENPTLKVVHKVGSHYPTSNCRVFLLWPYFISRARTPLSVHIRLIVGWHISHY